MGVTDLFQTIGALCMVQCESRAKSTTSDRIVSNSCASSLTLISMRLSGREPAFECDGKYAACSNWGCLARRWLSTWTPRVAFVSKPHWQPLQEQRSQRRCWSCLWGVPRFLHKNNNMIPFEICERKSPSWFSVVAVFPWFSAVEMATEIGWSFWFCFVNLVMTCLTRFGLVNLVMSSFNTARCSTLDRRSVLQQRIWMLEN